MHSDPRHNEPTRRATLVQPAPGKPACPIGYGTFPLAGPGAWGDGLDNTSAIRVLRHAAGLGVDLVETADAYGPFRCENLVASALYPYHNVTIVTKGGAVRTGPHRWHPLGKPAYLRQCVEMSLRRLRLEAIGLYHLYRIDPDVALADQLGVLDDMRREGKVVHIGLCQVTVAEVAEARMIAPVTCVQNRYSVAHRASDDVVDYCEREDMAFVPCAPLDGGRLARSDGPLGAIAKEMGRPPAQIALAWLLRRSPVIVPIPGSISIAHLNENATAGAIKLTEEQYRAISALSGAGD